ncbi:MAG: hypothetical protein O3C51_11900 [Planctomycetota bacterium]|nr:hypothetical protein [Planctomycetota bacterium]
MRSHLKLLATALALSPLAAAQEADPNAVDWRMPFRSPQANLVPPEDMWAHLRPMYEIARQAAPDNVQIEDGIEVVLDPSWLEHRKAFEAVRQDAGYVSLVLRDSKHVADRAIAFYGAFYLSDPQQVMQLIEHIPGEPSRGLREDAYRRAAGYIQAHLGDKVEGDLEAWEKLDVGPAGQRPPRPGEFLFGFDPTAFVALWSVDDDRDHEQGLWFLARCADARQGIGVAAWMLGRDRLRELAASGSPKVRVAVADFVRAVSGLTCTLEADASADDWVAWLSKAHDEVFPPLRCVSAGLYDLYPHADRDELARVGRAHLAAGTLGTDNVLGSTKAGLPYRGFRIEKLPAPLDQLGLEPGCVLISVNGTPTPTSARLTQVLERALPAPAQFVAEFVDVAGRNKAIRYRVLASW